MNKRPSLVAVGSKHRHRKSWATGMAGISCVFAMPATVGGR
jgi:hypothetical protein